MLRAIALSVCLAVPAAAQEDRVELYVEANLLAVLYHELGHALIDIQRLPIFGQQEDAADVLSVLLIDAYYEEQAAAAISYDAAFGFLGFAQGEDVAFWDVHGPDLQRYYTLVCLFYGASPEARADLAQELGLPDQRAETCPEEFALAADSWGPVLEEISQLSAAEPIRFEWRGGAGRWAEFTAVVIGNETEALSEDLALPVELTVTVEECGEVNAFYDPAAREIIICAEMAEELSLNHPFGAAD